MQNYNLGSLRDWSSVAIGEVIGFEVPETGHRTISFEIMSNAHVSVMVMTAGDGDSPGEQWLVGAGEGFTSVKFTVDDHVGVSFLGDPATTVYIRTFIKSQVIPENLDPSYTTIEPRPAGPTEEMRRMMHLVNLNNRRREEHLMQELVSMRAQIDSAAAAPAAHPVADPVPQQVGEGEE